MIRKLIVIFVVLLCSVVKANSAETPCEKLVLAGWFPWHGTPSFDSEWSRWNDTGHKPWLDDVTSMYWPKLGPYSGKDTTVLAQQAQWIQQSGSNIVVIFWNDTYPGEQERVEEAMRSFGANGLKGFIAVDANWTNPSFNDVLTRLDTVVGWYARYSEDYYNNFYYHDPCTGYPIFMVYDPGQTGTVTQWNDKIGWYKNNTPEHGIFIAGGGSSTPVEWMQYSLFDGYFWSGAADSVDDELGHEFLIWKLNSQSANHPFYMGGLTTGFDDRTNCDNPSPTVVDRQAGEVFISKWKGIINSDWNGYKIDWVYIPFNDWGEGGSIEPASNNPPLRGTGYESCGERVPQIYKTYLPREDTFYLTTNQNCTNEFLYGLPGSVCEASNILPAADAGGPYSRTEGQSITLDGRGSIDSDGTITKYEWDVNNDGIFEYSTSSATRNHTFSSNGTYTVRLRVTDNIGAINEDTTTATIYDTVPVVSFTASPTSGTLPLTVSFTNTSTGYDQPLSYAWDFDNNGTTDSTAQNPSKIYSSAGIFSVKLTVTDNDNSSNSLLKGDYITVTYPPVRIGGYYYSSIQAAYNASVSGDIIQAQAVIFSGDLTLNRNVTFTLAGGYSSDYSTIIGLSTLNGNMIINDGLVTVNNFTLQ